MCEWVCPSLAIQQDAAAVEAQQTQVLSAIECVATSVEFVERSRQAKSFLMQEVTMVEHYHRPAGMPPANGYSHAVAFSGRMLVISGQVPLDENGAVVGKDDPRSQMRQVFKNLALALASAGVSMEHVVKLTVYLTDLSDLEVFRSVRDEYVSLVNPPASSLLQVSGLVNPSFRVEID